MSGDLGESIGLLAINLVTPANLDAWPIEEIIQIRKRMHLSLTSSVQRSTKLSRISRAYIGDRRSCYNAYLY